MAGEVQRRHAFFVGADALLGAGSVAARLSREHPRCAGVSYAYGTAGFRDDAGRLASVVVRMGMLVCIRARTVGRSLHEQEASADLSAAVGVMVTASHNKASDNGIKMIDPDGGMLAQEWEFIATRVANAHEAEVCEVLRSIASEMKADWSIVPNVFIGADTRASSPRLSALLAEGIQALIGRVTDFGVVATPQLHYAVREHNARRPCQIGDYYRNLCSALWRALTSRLYENEREGPLQMVTIDCANGVGANVLRALSPSISQCLAMELINTGEGELNDSVGAEHVQKQRIPPRGVSVAAHKMRKMASIDGDADRLVYFYLDESGKLVLLDGDKITCLMATFIIELLRIAGLSERLSFGCVQTAYANGASTAYIRDRLGVQVDCVPTGVKYVHHKALEYDIGVYFEANGHGTALFKDSAVQCLEEIAESADEQRRNAATILLCMSHVFNQAVGDAVSDMLAVEVVLAKRNWGLPEWNALYTDVPSRMTKVHVKDRNAVQTTDAERKCVSPPGLQERIDKLVADVGGPARAFVRPSGTEDVVRVYTEAATQELADRLAELVGDAVSAVC